ncbi:MAG: hypothetical protein DRO06_03765 [Thermoproteota archaeon]|nr:MAG: hypothetical protein DRO06_03765 [Candidatus Korarchaeota archaeon]
MEMPEKGSIYVVDIKLLAEEEGELPPSGTYFRKIVIRALRSVDPLTIRSVLSSGLPITVSPFYRGPYPHVRCPAGPLPIVRGQEYKVRVVSSSSQVGEILRGWLSSRQRVVIEGVPLEYRESRVSEVSWDEIYSEEAVWSFRVRFLTPTSFRRSTTPYCRLFPLPSMLFGRLAAIWRRVSPYEAPDLREFVRWADLSVVETGYDLCTIPPVRVDGEDLVGFLGWVNFKVIEHPNWSPDEHEELAAWTARLLRMGELTGVGAGRTHGMGIIRFIPKPGINREGEA